MKVEKVYQDDKGEWHIDYGLTHLMGLAIRVYFGELLIGMSIFIVIVLPLLLLTSLAIGESLDELKNLDQASNHNTLPKSVCNKKSN